MARAGRKPKTTGLKVLRGERKDRTNVLTPTPRSTAPDRPSHLSADERRVWDRTVKVLDRSGVLTEIDSSILELYCVTFARWRRAVKELRKDASLTVISDSGAVKANPLATIVAQLSTQVQSLQGEFGMTPASRSRVSRADKPKDALADFLARKISS